MKLRLNRYSFEIKAFGLKFIIVFCFLLCYHFFYLLPLPGFLEMFTRNDYWNILMAVIYIGLDIIIYLKNKSLFSRYDRGLGLYFFFLITTFLLITIYSLFKYPKQSINDVMATGTAYLSLLAIPIYLKIFTLDKGEDRLVKTLDLIVFIWCSVALIQSYIYNATGSLIFDFNSYFDSSNNIATRVYGIRVGLMCLGNFTILYNFNSLYNNKVKKGEKLFCIIKFIVELIAIVSVQQTRMWTFIVLVCIGIQILFGNKSAKIRIVEISLIIIAYIALRVSGIIDNTISQYNAIGLQSHGISENNRLYAITYYLQTFFKNPVFGNGFTSYASVFYSSVEHGPLGIAYYVDVGIFGLLGQTGLCSIIFYFWPLIKMFKSYGIIRKHRKKIHSKYTLYISILVYVIISSSTLIITNYIEAGLFPIAVAIFLYHAANLKKSNINDI